MYTPKPTDTSEIKLPPELINLRERIAEEVHDAWAVEKIRQGKTDHPDLKPYAELTEDCKAYDRNTADTVLKLISALGFEIVTPRKMVRYEARTISIYDIETWSDLSEQGYEVKATYTDGMRGVYVVMQKRVG